MPTDAHFDGTIIPADEAQPVEEPSTEVLLERERAKTAGLESGLAAMTENRDVWLARAEAAEAGLRGVTTAVEEAQATVAALRATQAQLAEAKEERAAKAARKAAKKDAPNPG